MIYPQNFEQKIGFDQIRQLLKIKCLSTLGEERVDQMDFSDDYNEINRRLEQVTEFVRITQEEDDFPNQYFFDVRPSLKRIRVEGELVQSGQTLVTLVDGTEKWVIANYKETQTTDMRQGQRVEMNVDAIPGVTYEGRIVSISDATGSFYSLIPQDNSAGNFVKVEQRIPVRIEFTENNSKENLSRLRAGMNVECYVKLQ